MRTRDIVRKAWQITQVHLKKLIWYGAIPAFLGIVVSSVYLTYQYTSLKNSELFSHGNAHVDVIKSAKTVWQLAFHHPTISVILIVLGIIIFIAYMLLPPVFNGILINAVNQIRKYEPIQGCVEVGVRRFFPMFEFGLLTGSFSIITIFTESAFILRWWGERVFYVALPILLFIAMAGLIINFLFTYSEYFIVLEKKRLMKSLMESTVLVISNLRKTFLVFVLMVLIGARVILNVLLVLLIPMLVVALTSYLATVFLSTIGMVLIIIVGFVVLIISSYLMGLCNVFATTVWVLTFAQLSEMSQAGESDDDDE
jgi:hypothetical protein